MINFDGSAIYGKHIELTIIFDGNAIYSKHVELFINFDDGAIYDIQFWINTGKSPATSNINQTNEKASNISYESSVNTAEYIRNSRKTIQHSKKNQINTRFSIPNQTGFTSRKSVINTKHSGIYTSTPIKKNQAELLNSKLNSLSSLHFGESLSPIVSGTHTINSMQHGKQNNLNAGTKNSFKRTTTEESKSCKSEKYDYNANISPKKLRNNPEISLNDNDLNIISKKIRNFNENSNESFIPKETNSKSNPKNCTRSFINSSKLHRKEQNSTLGANNSFKRSTINETESNSWKSFKLKLSSVTSSEKKDYNDYIPKNNPKNSMKNNDLNAISKKTRNFDEHSNESLIAGDDKHNSDIYDEETILKQPRRKSKEINSNSFDKNKNQTCISKCCLFDDSKRPSQISCENIERVDISKENSNIYMEKTISQSTSLENIETNSTKLNSLPVLRKSKRRLRQTYLFESTSISDDLENDYKNQSKSSSLKNKSPKNNANNTVISKLDNSYRTRNTDNTKNESNLKISNNSDKNSTESSSSLLFDDSKRPSTSRIIIYPTKDGSETDENFEIVQSKPTSLKNKVVQCNKNQSSKSRIDISKGNPKNNNKLTSSENIKRNSTKSNSPPVLTKSKRRSRQTLQLESTNNSYRNPNTDKTKNDSKLMNSDNSDKDSSGSSSSLLFDNCKRPSPSRIIIYPTKHDSETDENLEIIQSKPPHSKNNTRQYNKKQSSNLKNKSYKTNTNQASISKADCSYRSSKADKTKNENNLKNSDNSDKYSSGSSDSLLFDSSKRPSPSRIIIYPTKHGSETDENLEINQSKSPNSKNNTRQHNKKQSSKSKLDISKGNPNTRMKKNNSQLTSSENIKRKSIKSNSPSVLTKSKRRSKQTLQVESTSKSDDLDDKNQSKSSTLKIKPPKNNANNTVISKLDKSYRNPNTDKTKNESNLKILDNSDKNSTGSSHSALFDDSKHSSRIIIYPTKNDCDTDENIEIIHSKSPSLKNKSYKTNKKLTSISQADNSYRSSYADKTKNESSLKNSDNSDKDSSGSSNSLLFENSKRPSPSRIIIYPTKNGSETDENLEIIHSKPPSSKNNTRQHNKNQSSKSKINISKENSKNNNKITSSEKIKRNSTKSNSPPVLTKSLSRSKQTLQLESTSKSNDLENDDKNQSKSSSLKNKSPKNNANKTVISKLDNFYRNPNIDKTKNENNLMNPDNFDKDSTGSSGSLLFDNSKRPSPSRIIIYPTKLGSETDENLEIIHSKVPSSKNKTVLHNQSKSSSLKNKSYKTNTNQADSSYPSLNTYKNNLEPSENLVKNSTGSSNPLIVRSSKRLPRQILTTGNDINTDKSNQSKSPNSQHNLDIQEISNTEVNNSTPERSVSNAQTKTNQDTSTHTTRNSKRKSQKNNSNQNINKINKSLNSSSDSSEILFDVKRKTQKVFRDTSLENFERNSTKSNSPPVLTKSKRRSKQTLQLKSASKSNDLENDDENQSKSSSLKNKSPKNNANNTVLSKLDNSYRNPNTDKTKNESNLKNLDNSDKDSTGSSSSLLFDNSKRPSPSRIIIYPTKHGSETDENLEIIQSKPPHSKNNTRQHNEKQSSKCNLDISKGNPKNNNKLTSSEYIKRKSTKSNSPPILRKSKRRSRQTLQVESSSKSDDLENDYKNQSKSSSLKNKSPKNNTNKTVISKLDNSYRNPNTDNTKNESNLKNLDNSDKNSTGSSNPLIKIITSDNDVNTDKINQLKSSNSQHNLDIQEISNTEINNSTSERSVSNVQTKTNQDTSNLTPKSTQSINSTHASRNTKRKLQQNNSNQNINKSLNSSSGSSGILFDVKRKKRKLFHESQLPPLDSSAILTDTKYSNVSCSSGCSDQLKHDYTKLQKTFSRRTTILY
ncbi:putative uncharacterized protein DDB_G0282133 [Chrysoperla carnea]|uniref:putative uncharacterized protein DDB_G0282133 n=1 Tax=Chrysoperla carnea TaxID=189513 RepID=UPI001D062593|nr:putative uncharacterized protein DDB_G0282133 [Chrysoperla carnea]